MSTEISTKKKSTELSFLALEEGSDVAEAIEANLTGGEVMNEQDLVQVKIPTGGSTTWEFDDITGVVETKTLTGICVYWGAGGLLWPTQEIGGRSTPLLVTSDLVTARKVGDDYGDLDEAMIESFRNPDGSYDWVGLSGTSSSPLGFGSGRNGGKRVDEHRNICLLRESDTFPVMIRVKAGSFSTILPFVKKLPVPFYRAILELSLEKVENQTGQTFSRIMPRLAGTLTREQGEVIRSTYTAGLKQTFDR